MLRNGCFKLITLLMPEVMLPLENVLQRGEMRSKIY